MYHLEFKPPIESRSTDELITIANHPDDWNATVVRAAKSELQERGITEEYQKERLDNWKREAELENKREMEARANASYSLLDKIWLALFWPYTVLQDWTLKKDGYFRLHRERLYLIGIGIIFYVVMMWLGNQNANRAQIEEYNEINQYDIYEWEKEYYSDEQIKEFRRNSIEQTISTVEGNIGKGVPTYIIVDGDTISNENIHQIRELELLNIRNVVHQVEYEPKHHELIKIKLIEPTDNIGYE